MPSPRIGGCARGRVFGLLTSQDRQPLSCCWPVMRSVINVNCRQQGWTNKGFPNYDFKPTRFARMILVLAPMTLTFGPTSLEYFIHDFLCLSNEFNYSNGALGSNEHNHTGITKGTPHIQQRCWTPDRFVSFHEFAEHERIMNESSDRLKRLRFRLMVLQDWLLEVATRGLESIQ